MNPIIITAIIAVAAFILTIFSADWLNQRHVDRLINQLDMKFDAKLDALRSEMKALRSEMMAEFAKVHAEIQNLSQRVEALTQRVDRIERQLDTIFKPTLPRT